MIDRASGAVGVRPKGRHAVYDSTLAEVAKMIIERAKPAGLASSVVPAISPVTIVGTR